MRTPTVTSRFIQAALAGVVLIVGLVVAPQTAEAQWRRPHEHIFVPAYHRPWGGGWDHGWHNGWDRGYHSGRWEHSWHNGHYGWWWVNGLAWSLYNAPTYPYPENQTTIIYEPAPAPVVVAPPQPPPPPEPPYPPVSVPGDQTPPSNGTYYFCESSQLYYPYARTCSEKWKIVPQAPTN